MLENLPLDLVSCVLELLPAKAAVCLSLVCKQWATFESCLQTFDLLGIKSLPIALDCIDCASKKLSSDVKALKIPDCNENIWTFQGQSSLIILDFYLAALWSPLHQASLIFMVSSGGQPLQYPQCHNRASVVCCLLMLAFCCRPWIAAILHSDTPGSPTCPWELLWMPFTGSSSAHMPGASQENGKSCQSTSSWDYLHFARWQAKLISAW